MGVRDPRPVDAARWLDELVAAHERRVLAYALRRTPTEADAEEISAETFVVAWRRRRDVPTDALPWLLAVARRLIANQRRAQQRRSGLLARLMRQDPEPAVAGLADEGPAQRALARMGADDQELLRLVVWDELDHRSIGLVLGITPNAVAIRLHRARQRLRDEFLKDSGTTRTSTEAKGNLNGAVQEPGND